MKRLLSMAMLAVLCAGNAGSAQEAGTGFQRAISVMPANVFHPGQVELASFLDLSLLTQLNDGQMGVTAFQRVGNVRGMTPLIALVRGGDEAWNKIGVDPARMDFFADFGQPPFSGVIWGFADEAVATSVFAGLADQGFSPLEAQPAIVANGTPLQINLDQADPFDPWRGPMGQTAVIAQIGPVLVQAIDPDIFDPLMNGTRASDTPAGQVLLAALGAQDGAVLQASFGGPAVGIAGAPVGMVAPETDPGAVGEDMDRLAPGVPIYGGVVIADLVGADSDNLVIAMAYADCETASRAAEIAARLWPERADGAAMAGQATPSHVEAGDAGCAAVITVPGEPDDSLFLRTMGALMQRDLAAVRIAE